MVGGGYQVPSGVSIAVLKLRGGGGGGASGFGCVGLALPLPSQSGHLAQRLNIDHHGVGAGTPPLPSHVSHKLRITLPPSPRLRP